MNFDRTFLEMSEVEQLVDRLRHVDQARVFELETIETYGLSYPVYGIVIGPDDPSLPTFGLFSGVHGLEKVGTHIVVYYLNSLLAQLKWDQGLRRRFQNGRIVSIPLINPGGMRFHRRCNPNGVDLMRNAPVEASNPPFLLGGHRLSRHLPWYRGKKGSPMEKECLAVVDFVKREMFPSRASVLLDIHSGFGAQDRLWYPWAKSREPFPREAEALEIKALLDASHSCHIYKVEPQSRSYTTHGDLWDFLFMEHERSQEYSKNILLPWTLELGSWVWVRKNPKQMFSAIGPFNPIEPHRFRRIMRRHHLLLDFLFRAALYHDMWRSHS